MTPTCLEVVDGHLYDTISLSRHSSAMFVSALGQYDHTLGRDKKNSETNVMIGGMMPAPGKFLVEQIEASLWRSNKFLPLTDDSLWGQVTIALRLMMDVRFGPCPIFEIADPRCVLAAAADSSDIEKRIRSIVSRKTWEPIAIDTLQPFAVYVQTEQIDPSVSLRVSLRGKHYQAAAVPTSDTEAPEELRKPFNL